MVVIMIIPLMVVITLVMLVVVTAIHTLLGVSPFS